MRFPLLLLLCFFTTISTVGQTPSPTYSDTRQLLAKMDGTYSDKYLRQLFEQAHIRQQDLIEALYDPEQKINLQSQKVMRYLAQPEMLSAIEIWFEYRKQLKQDYWWPNAEEVKGVKYLKGGGRDLANLVLRNLYSKVNGAWAKVVAYNKHLKTALIEVVIGEIFTEGHHVSIRKENGKWRVLVNTLKWQS